MFAKLTIALFGATYAQFTVDLHSDADRNEFGPMFIGSNEVSVRAVYDTAAYFPTVIAWNTAGSKIISDYDYSKSNSSDIIKTYSWWEDHRTKEHIGLC